MLILAFESSAKAASVALCRDASLISQYTQCSGLTHSRTLLPMAEDLLKNAEMSLSDIDLFAVAHGPGSFTGIRIGVATAKGLAFPNDLPCVAVSTLEAMAYRLSGLPLCGRVCAVMDARCKQVYTATFLVDNGEFDESGLVGLGYSLDGKSFFYENPLEINLREREMTKKYRDEHPRFPITQRVEVFGCSCCPVNVVRFIPQIAQFAYATRGDAAYVNLFVESDVTLKLSGGAVKLSQKTAYPWQGASALVVTPVGTGRRFGLSFQDDGSAVAIRDLTTNEFAHVDNFISGATWLTDGKPRGAMSAKPDRGPLAPRTFVGARNGEFLVVMTSDGRQPGVSDGLDYAEGAELLRQFGCEDGFFLDGGGSTVMAIREDALKGLKGNLNPAAHPSESADGYIIMNRPSDGNERAVLDHLMFIDRVVGHAQSLL